MDLVIGACSLIYGGLCGWVIYLVFKNGNPSAGKNMSSYYSEPQSLDEE